MNFYQRANLSLSLAVVFGLQVAILSQLTTKGLVDLWDNSKPVLAWMIFQIIFKCKMMFDDHLFFQSNGFKKSKTKWLHFLSLVCVNAMHAVAASTTYITNASVALFGIGLFISSIWVAGDLTSKSDDDMRIPIWFMSNTALIIIALFWIVGVLGTTLAPVVMLLIVAFDFYKGETWREPPSV